MTAFEEIVPQVAGQLDVQDGRCSFRVSASQKKLDFPEISRPYLEGFARGLTIRQMIETLAQKGEPVEFSVLRKTLQALGDHGAIENYDVFRDHVVRTQFNENSSVLKLSFLQADLIDAAKGLQAFFQLVTFLALWAAAAALVQRWLDLHIFNQLALFFVPTLAISLRVWVMQLWSWLAQGETRPLSVDVSLLGILPDAEWRRLRPVVAVVSLIALVVPLLLFWPSVGIYRSLLQALTLMTIYLEIPSLPGWKQERSRAVWMLATMAMIFFVVQALIELWRGFLLQSYPELAATSLVTVALAYFLLDVVVFLWQSSSKGARRAEEKVEEHDIDFYEARKDQILAAVPLFQTLPPAMIKDLTDKIQILNFSRQIYVCRTGDRSTDLYLLLQGQVGVFKRTLLHGSELIVTLQPGSLFGEGGFFFQKPRDADVVALEDSIVCRIRRPKSIGWSHILDEKSADVFRKGIWAYQALAGSSLFAKLPQDALRMFLNRGRILSVQPGAVVVREGDIGHEFYILIQGKMEVTVEGRHLRELYASDFFGEIALIRRTPRTATVRALDECLVFRLDEKTFWEVLSVNLALACHLEKAALKRMRNQVEMV